MIFPNILLVFVSYLHRKVVKGSGVGSAECVVHVDLHEEWVMLCGWLQFNGY